MDNFDPTYKSSDSGKTPHQLVQEYVAKITDCTDYDKCFDQALALGKREGVGAYDESITYILKELGIPEDDVLKHLRDNGVDI